jgi:ectoine hydroxylase-related dioxygenase (phytanoyl-CoA dioxygenase family)
MTNASDNIADSAAEDQRNEDYTLSQAQIDAYRRDGFIQLNDMITGPALTHLRDAVANAVDREKELDILGRDQAKKDPNAPKGVYEQIFIQRVNLWSRYPEVKKWVTCRRFGNVAARLSGRPARVWHDQALFKEPNTGNNKTPWHQDAVYWPHQNRWDQITIWIALKDATIQNGCMSFIGGTHSLGPVPAIDLGNPQDIFQYAPHIKPVKPVTCELKAGSVTFHNGLTFHYAGPNKSEGMREAFAVIYMPDGTCYDGHGHIVTDVMLEKKPAAGDKLDGPLFPLVSDVV